MGLETGDYVSNLVPANPLGTDLKSQGDDHLRLLKKAIKNTLCGFSGAALVTGSAAGDSSAHVITPTTPLVSYTAGTMLLYQCPATIGGAFTVDISGLGAKSVKTLSGLDSTAGDISAGDYVLLVYDGTNFVELSGGGYVAKTGDQTLTGDIEISGDLDVSGNQIVSGNVGISGKTTLNEAIGITLNHTDDSQNLATTAFVKNVINNLYSLDLKGTPTATTADVLDNSTRIATTEFVARGLANEAARATAADAVIAANVGSALGINFGAFYMNDGELIVTHLTTTTPSIVSGDLILTYETL